MGKAKTAEEIAVEHDLIEIYDGDKHRVDPEVIAAMEEFAEQARREERERHSKLLAFAREQVAGMVYPGVAFKEALAAAGYEGKEGE